MDFLSKKDLSIELGISITTINKMMKENKISFIKIGRRVIFSLKQVKEDLLALQTLSDQTIQ